MPPATLTSIFVALLLSGLLGMVGQGVRVVAGLKKRNPNQDPSDVFVASRLVVSLLIGFIAGVVAGLSLGLSKILAITDNDIDLLLGIVAAGYAGTDFIEAFVPRITGAPAPAQPAAQPAPTATTALVNTFNQATTTGGAVNARYGVTFGSLVPGGFFSANPDDVLVHRSIRTNNPGALNFASWQKARKGFVGVTQPDNSPDHNVTSIYRTPEHGVAAWYHLVAVIYAFPGGNFTLDDLASRYAGGAAAAAAIQAYVGGWNRWLNPPVAPNTMVQVTDSQAMVTLAKAMFSHEAGAATPLSDEQITFGIDREVSNSLPG